MPQSCMRRKGRKKPCKLITGEDDSRSSSREKGEEKARFHHARGGKSSSPCLTRGREKKWGEYDGRHRSQKKFVGVFWGGFFMKREDRGARVVDRNLF